MTDAPDPITTPEQAYRELGRARALVEDRVDPLVGLILAAVQTYLATSHPALDEPPFFGDWPPLERLALEGAAAAELAQDLDVATRAGFTNQAQVLAFGELIYCEERKEASFRLIDTEATIPWWGQSTDVGRPPLTEADLHHPDAA